MLSAAGRRRTNQGDTIALIAAAPVAAQPKPLNSVAAKSCHGSRAIAHPRIPSTAATAPARVSATNPKRRYNVARLATTTAPSRKWHVTAADTSDTGQLWASWIACRKTGGP